MKKIFIITIILALSLFAHNDSIALSIGKNKSSNTKKYSAPRKSSSLSKKSYSSNTQKTIIIREKSDNSASKTTTKKEGIVSKIVNSAARGYGWQLGREAAKETIKGAKKLKDNIMNKQDNK